MFIVLELVLGSGSKIIGKEPGKKEYNPTTLLWSIKREKWFRVPALPEDISMLFHNDFNYYEEFKRMCVISVGLNTAFVLNKKTYI